MQVIEYPTQDPRDGFVRAWQQQFDREAARREFRRTVRPRLRSLFLQINADVFGGKLPEPVIEFADTPRRGVLGQCENRFWSWNETYRIVVRPEVVDGPVDELEAVVRHEVAHVAQWALGGKAGADEDAHGPVFRRMLERIDEGTGGRWVGKINVEGEPTTPRRYESLAAARRAVNRATRERAADLNARIAPGYRVVPLQLPPGEYGSRPGFLVVDRSNRRMDFTL